MILNTPPPFNPMRGRCKNKKCERVLTAEEEGQKWCNKCRDKERDKNGRRKENRETRDSVAALFGYDRKAAREQNKKQLY